MGVFPSQVCFFGLLLEVVPKLDNLFNGPKPFQPLQLFRKIIGAVRSTGKEYFKGCCPLEKAKSEQKRRRSEQKFGDTCRDSSSSQLGACREPTSKLQHPSHSFAGVPSPPRPKPFRFKHRRPPAPQCFIQNPPPFIVQSMSSGSHHPHHPADIFSSQGGQHSSRCHVRSNHGRHPGRDPSSMPLNGGHVLGRAESRMSRAESTGPVLSGAAGWGNANVRGNANVPWNRQAQGIPVNPVPAQYVGTVPRLTTNSTYHVPSGGQGFKYAEQLQELKRMGYTDDDQLKQILQATKGNMSIVRSWLGR